MFEEQSNFIYPLIKFLIPFLLGSLVFFSFIVAPNTFKNLDSNNARKFIRSIFPKLYLWSLIISFVITILFLANNHLFAFIFFFVSLGYLFSRQFLMKEINKTSDSLDKSIKLKKKFQRLHSLSVLIFVTQILLITFIYISI